MAHCADRPARATPGKGQPYPYTPSSWEGPGQTEPQVPRLPEEPAVNAAAGGRAGVGAAGPQDAPCPRLPAACAPGSWDAALPGVSTTCRQPALAPRGLALWMKTPGFEEATRHPSITRQERPPGAALDTLARAISVKRHRLSRHRVGTSGTGYPQPETASVSLTRQFLLVPGPVWLHVLCLTEHAGRDLSVRARTGVRHAGQNLRSHHPQVAALACQGPRVQAPETVNLIPALRENTASISPFHMFVLYCF